MSRERLTSLSYPNVKASKGSLWRRPDGAFPGRGFALWQMH